jgi:hypothetical protein
VRESVAILPSADDMGSWEVARCRADSDELVHDSASRRQRYGCAMVSNMMIMLVLQ